MATFMGEEMSGRYSKEVNDLIAWFEERLPEKGAFVMSQADYQTGVDALKSPQHSLVNVAFTEWLSARQYDLSYNQTCQAFFAAAKNLNLLTIGQRQETATASAHPTT